MQPIKHYYPGKRRRQCCYDRRGNRPPNGVTKSSPNPQYRRGHLLGDAGRVASLPCVGLERGPSREKADACFLEFPLVRRRAPLAIIEARTFAGAQGLRFVRGR